MCQLFIRINFYVDGHTFGHFRLILLQSAMYVDTLP